MRMKRALALLLAVSALCGMLVLPPAVPVASAASGTAFTDIYNADVAEAAETLRLLGIVSGTGGTAFQPDRALTRAEFCKMAVELMGNGDKVPSQMNRTVFQDVPSTHWARGYIAVATQGTTTGSGEDAVTTSGIIRGDAYGNFNPDRPITYAEAVTILVRILGYGDSEVGMVWPDGYLSKADELGITEGVSLQAGDTMTRGQTALLMENLLFADGKDGKEYLTTLGCTITDETILFDVAATAPDGSSGIKVAQDKVYKTDHAPFSDDLVGRRAKLVLDKDEKVVDIQASTSGTQKVITIQSLDYDAMKISGGSSISIEEPKDTVVWKDGKETTYEELYLSGMAAGTQALLQYSAAGELEYIFLRSSAKSDSTTRVVKNKPNYSDDLAYTVYKNGILAKGSDIRQYDVTTFDEASNVMYVSDARITGIYENVYPNRETPATITVMGHEFPVLSSATTDLSSFKIGDTITLLLSYNGQVAGAVEPSVAKATAVGTVKSVDKDSGATVVTSINMVDASGKPLELSGTTSYTGSRADDMVGQLVTVSSASKGRLSLSKLTGKGSDAPLNVDEKRMNTVKLSDNVKLYEQVGRSTLTEIKLEDITRATVPADLITYVHKDYAGNADIVVFNDVTGDRYEYGFFKVTTEGGQTDTEGNTTQRMDYVSIINALTPNGSSNLLMNNGESLRNNKAGGIVTGPARTDGKVTLGGFVELQSMDVKSSAFDVDNMTVTTNSMIIPISDRVMCYNETTKEWFSVGEGKNDEDYVKALNLARAFSENVTIYYDKAPDQGGKIRIVVVG
ncbi:S-layer homology domain-containing protein [uncultured Intestinimonas sp.]|uniref:S-layer homology domain-containing protein n=1 Tax=uncultured Intestinimonas sp. TaxID=1689265 RepID=UPI0025D90B83|nr:S-layer homology domain-containing protein [uncultured Intestinimonas sp.]